MGSTSLVVADSIKVLTQNGECQIDMCLGDITKLKRKDKVDVICVSAFANDYAATPTSVIGALKRTLDISVRNLARDKEEDLRKLYSCWWSKPLPDKLPYKRLLCFETRSFGAAGRPQELVANVFRCLVPILNNEDGSVITPLLNTGDQGYGEVSMMKGMVEAAVKWMKAGLPLRILKLVLYAKVIDGDLQSHSLRRFSEVRKKFTELKERYEMQLLLPKAVPLEFDVYLSFSEEDEGVAKVIREKLTGAKEGVRIYDSSQQDINKDSVFQEDMYTIMMKSARVVTVLSPNYLKNKACIEQYNIALCCNRRALRDMLAPIYVDSVEMMPTYMGLVQYVDCRPHDPSKIGEACTQLSVSLSVTFHTELRVAEFDPLRYDIFLSYSHRDTEKANRFVALLQKLAPDLKLFFDVQELKTGKSWQRTLYHSIDGSRCMLALISKPYLKSAVCQEEFALAQAKHYSKGKQHLQLIPICLEDLDTIQTEFTHIPMVKGTPDVFDDMVKTVCPAVIQWLKGERVDQTETIKTLFDDKSIPTLSADEEMEKFRHTSFQKEFGSKDSVISAKRAFPPILSKILPDEEDKKDERPMSASDCDLIFSYHSDDEKYVSFMARLLAMKAPSLKVKAVSSDEHNKLNSLERSHCIVPVLSPNYLESPECVEEFHIAIWRQRISNPEAGLLLPISIHTLPQKPTYFHLVQTAVSLTDGLWAQLSGGHKCGLSRDVVDMSSSMGKMQLSQVDMLALYMAVYHILRRFEKGGKRKEEDFPTKPALINVMKLKEQTKQITEPDYTDQLCKTLLELHINDIPESWREGSHYLRPKENNMAATEGGNNNSQTHNTVNETTKDSSGRYHSDTQEKKVLEQQSSIEVPKDIAQLVEADGQDKTQGSAEQDKQAERQQSKEPLAVAKAGEDTLAEKPDSSEEETGADGDEIIGNHGDGRMEEGEKQKEETEDEDKEYGRVYMSAPRSSTCVCL
nr:uncharacterized protein LOC129270701 isoform X1 [Lytechinus pictus]